MAKKLAQAGQEWSRRAAAEMPSASGDIREIVDQPVFVPLYSLFRVYGPIFKLSFGPQSFVVISDPAMAKQVRWPAFLRALAGCMQIPHAVQMYAMNTAHWRVASTEACEGRVRLRAGAAWRT